MERLEPDFPLEVGKYQDRVDEVNELIGSLEPESISERELNEVRQKLKSEVIDHITYGEIFSERLAFLESFKDRYGLRSDEEVIDAFLHGDGESLLKDEIDIFIEDSEDSVFENESEFADAVIADYYFRQGKGLRSMLTVLTEYSLADRITPETALVGGIIDILHTSTLHQDDEMDDDDERRGDESGNVINEKAYGDSGEFMSIIDGNEMEAWTNQMSCLLPRLSVPDSASFAFSRSQELVNDGQRTDMLMEGWNIEDIGMDDYEEMSMHKTGYLFMTAVKMAIDNVYQDRGPTTVYRAFDRYVENLNYAFQGQDDFLEAFRDTQDKSATDITNRKKTMAPVKTYQQLVELSIEENVRAGELFLYFFNEDYTGESVGSFGSNSYDDWMEEAAEVIGVELPDNRYDCDDWVREVMAEYGEEVTGEQLKGYADRGEQMINYLEDEGAFRNEEGPELLRELVQFMPNRAI